MESTPQTIFLISIVLPKLDWANEQVKDNEEEGDLAGGEDEEAEVVEGLLHLHQLPHCHHHLDLKLVAQLDDLWITERHGTAMYYWIFGMSLEYPSSSASYHIVTITWIFGTSGCLQF